MLRFPRRARRVDSLVASPPPSRSIADVDWSLYDFLDLGCSSGRSVPYGVRRFGGSRGLGVDLDEKKVRTATDAGIEAVVGDATRLNLSKQVRFVSMLDFLEHLPDPETAERVIASAAEAATDFLFIRHPSFEGQEQVEAQGFRQYWWHWTGHTCHLRVSDYCEIFDRLGLRTYMVRYLGRIDNSHNPTVITTDRPVDTVIRDIAQSVEEKPLVTFVPPLWRLQDLFVALRPMEREEWEAITTLAARDRMLLS